jgi:hypothetical protein
MEGVFAAIDRFFIDIIGTIVPGGFFILGIWIIMGQPFLFGSMAIFPVQDISGWILLIVLAYVAGHAISSIGKGLTGYIIEPIFGKFPLGKRKINFVKSGDDLREQIQKRADFYTFVEQIEKKFPRLRSIPGEDKNFGFWRNIALSTSKDNSLVYRFVFISLLNLGIATDLILLAILWLLLWFLSKHGFIQNIEPMNWLVWSFMIFAALPFLERYYQFHRRSLQIPFSMALVALREEDSNQKEGSSSELKFISTTAKVYLAGGFRSGWQRRVKESLPDFKYLDPRQHDLSDPTQYTLWDLEAIRQCDIVFAILEADNPGGYALSLELGYAKALNKIIVFVDERSNNEESEDPHFAMLRTSSTKVFDSLDEGILFMKSLETVYD